VKFWLLTPHQNQVQRLTILKNSWNNNNNGGGGGDDDNNNKSQQKSPQQTLASEPNCAAIFVLLTAKERAHSAPDVTWACAWCLVLWNITQK